MAQAFQDLTVWQRAMEMTVCIYELTKTFPKDEMYGLTPQLRRATVSVASNIAEGRGRMTDGEFRQFLGIAQGSTYEVQTQLLVARRLKIGNEEVLSSAEALCIETSKMLGAFLQSLLIRRLNTVRVPHPFPRLLRKWVGDSVTVFLPNQ